MTFYLDNVLSCTQTLLRVVSGWIPRHVIGAVLVSLPAVSVFSHLACSLHLPIQVRRDREGKGGGQTGRHGVLVRDGQNGFERWSR